MIRPPKLPRPSLIALSFTLLSFALASCPMPQKPDAKMGTLRIAIPGKDEGRMTFEDYVDTLSFVLTGEGPAELLGEPLQAGENQLTLLPGAWSLRLSVRNSADTEVGYDEETVTIEAGKLARVNFVIALENPNPDTHTITFDSSGGTTINPPSLEIPWKTANPSPSLKSLGKSLPTPPFKQGYIFNGWHTAETGGTPFTVETAVSANLTVYAHWEENLPGDPDESGTYTVTFDSAGGATMDPPTMSIPWNNDNRSPTLLSLGLSLPTPTRQGFDFAGWHTTETGGTAFTVETAVSENLTVYAQWQENITHHDGSFTITFADITDLAPDITGPDLSRSGNSGVKTAELRVSPEGFESVTWNLYGETIEEQTLTFSVDPVNPAYNIEFDLLGDHFITVTVVKDGIPYSKTITFTIEE